MWNYESSNPGIGGWVEARITNRVGNTICTGSSA